MKKFLILPLALAAALAGGAVKIVQDQCGPFTDVTPAFCPFVSELYYLGITAGTSATTFSPDDPLTRGQAAVFVAKGLNQSLARSSRRAALGQWWTTQTEQAAAKTVVGTDPLGIASDGQDIWVASGSNHTVARVRASDGKLLETWTGADGAAGLVIAMGRVFITGSGSPGRLYMIDPSQPSGDVTTVASGLGGPNFDLRSVAFDGSRLWVADFGAGLGPGSISIVTPAGLPPWPFTTVTDGIGSPMGLVFDGANVWATDYQNLIKFDSNGVVIQSVPLGNTGSSFFPGFDGRNIWVPTLTPNVVQVVRAVTGEILATLSGNGLDTGGKAIAFDGERMLVTCGDHVSIWRASDLSPLGSIPVTANGQAASDGVNFWLGNGGFPGYLVRF